MAIRRYCDHIGIFTNNIKRLNHFYTRKLGFELLSETLVPAYVIKAAFGLNHEAKMQKLVFGSFMIEIFKLQGKRFIKRSTSTAGISHWAFFVGDRLKYINRLEHKAIKVIKIKRESNFTYFVKDPDGNLIELRE